MVKQLEVLFGFVVLLGVIVVFLVGIVWTRPSDLEVTAKRQYNSETLQAQINDFNIDAVYAKIKDLNVNGQVPVRPYKSGTDYSVNNPFEPYYLRK